MIKREGFISVIALFTMSILMIMSSYLVKVTYIEDLILVHTRNNIQSYYLAEGKVQMVLFDKYYTDELFPFLLEAIPKTANVASSKDIIIDEEDLDEFDNLTKVKVSIGNKNNRKEIEIISDADYKGTKTNIVASGPVVNKFFELENPILSHSNIDDSLEEDFTKLLNKIYNEISINYSNKPFNFYGGEFSNFEKIILNQIDLCNSYLYAYRETMIEPYVEHIDKNHIILIIKGYDDNSVNLILGNEEEINRPMELNGLIFVEGNITVFNNLNFNGIIIVKDGDIIVNSNEKPKINGILISYNNSSSLNNENIQVIYNKDNIYNYGIYLPGFIEPKIELIKSN